MKKILESLYILGFISVICLGGNFIGYGIFPLEALPGMLVLATTAFLGQFIHDTLKIRRIPAVVIISLLGLAIVSPISPLAPYIIKLVEKVNFMALATPVLACAGIGLGTQADNLRKEGVKLFIVSLMVFSGTFLVSAFISEGVFRFLGIPAP